MGCLSASGFNHRVRDPGFLASHGSTSEAFSNDKQVSVTCIIRLKNYFKRQKNFMVLHISCAKL